MDDITDKISGLLSDPDSMERIRQMAQGLLASQPSADSSPDNATPDITKLLPIISKINSTADDSRVTLLKALRPHLSAARQKRLDTAVKLLRAAQFLPLLQSLDIFG